jgi:hypothetical protein
MSEGINDALVKENMVGDNKILNQPWAWLRAWLRCIGRVDGDGSGKIVMRAHGRFPVLKTDAQQQSRVFAGRSRLRGRTKATRRCSSVEICKFATISINE